MLQAEVLECPQCGAPLKLTDQSCAFCHSPVILKKMEDISPKKTEEINKYILWYKSYLQNTKGENAELFHALGLCYLKKEAFGVAASYFEKAIASVPEDGESYYYLALAKLNKKRPYRQTLTVIKEIVELLNSALTYYEEGKYYYLLYLVQIDFFDKKRLRNGKSADELLKMAIHHELDSFEKMECERFCDL
ncbi:MAG: hypothetical protein IKZ43_06290 [Acidaminococcaceae bacterium]|nr:hypothetical protein [Acidaminococcaceae bacterium]